VGVNTFYAASSLLALGTKSGKNPKSHITTMPNEITMSSPYGENDPSRGRSERTDTKSKSEMER